MSESGMSKIYHIKTEAQGKELEEEWRKALRSNYGGYVRLEPVINWANEPPSVQTGTIRLIAVPPDKKDQIPRLGARRGKISKLGIPKVFPATDALIEEGATGVRYKAVPYGYGIDPDKLAVEYSFPDSLKDPGKEVRFLLSSSQIKARRDEPLNPYDPGEAKTPFGPRRF